MTSKYDDFWAGQLPRIRAQLQLAAGGTPAPVSVPGLTQLGGRQSWHGVAEVRMREMTYSSGAHATSLGKTVAASGICAQWPERAFRFTIGSRGDVLTITAGRITGGPPGDVPGRIFMSYRREETAYPAAWLYGRLASQFGRHQVFKDVDSIEPGDDFAEIITTAVEACDVLLALIGRQWLTIADQEGRPRLDDPADFVRLEIEAALTRNIRVIPILVDGARLPRAEDLPPSLASLTRRQALELSPVRFDADIQRLLRVLERLVAEAREQAGEQTDRETANVTRQERERLPQDNQQRIVTRITYPADRGPADSDISTVEEMLDELVRRGGDPVRKVDAALRAMGYVPAVPERMGGNPREIYLGWADPARNYTRGRFTLSLDSRTVWFSQQDDRKRIQDMPGAYTTGSYVAIRISVADGVAHATAAARQVKR